jgi:hypothetical protein
MTFDEHGPATYDEMPMSSLAYLFDSAADEQTVA